jgi:ornithine cyclodeaminase/alanine dehydrogenase-like protein (mu-crystallin family)
MVHGNGILYLSRAQVERLLDVDSLIDVLASALVSFSAGMTSVPPRIAAHVPARGLMGAMVGYVPGAGLAAKLVSVFPENHQRGEPSHQALIALFDEGDGTPLAVMDGTYITAMRTGGAAAVAARALARQDAEVLAVLGAGTQGRSHLETFPRVRNFTEIRVASRDTRKAAALAARHPRARVATSFEAAVRGADVVACCTDAREPVLRREWLKAGAHVSSVGGTFGPELGADTLTGGRIFVEWRGAATNAPPAGACELQGFELDRLTEIGEVLSGARPGRQFADELTVYKSTGHAAEDAAAARLVYDRARAAGVGIQLPAAAIGPQNVKRTANCMMRASPDAGHARKPGSWSNRRRQIRQSQGAAR